MLTAMKDLTPKEQLFVMALLSDPEMRVGPAAVTAGFSAKTAGVQGSKVLRRPRVLAALEEGKAKRLARMEKAAALSQDEVVGNITAVLRADPRELAEIHIDACRHCHGEGFRYQRTPGEMERDYEMWLANPKRAPDAVFDLKGGSDFDPRRGPREDCPECHGRGERMVIIKDSRTLSPSAAKLYAGIKVTKDGIEIKTRSQDKHAEMAGKHLGIFIDRVEHTGKDGGPQEHVVGPIDYAVIRSKIVNEV